MATERLRPEDIEQAMAATRARRRGTGEDDRQDRFDLDDDAPSDWLSADSDEPDSLLRADPRDEDFDLPAGDYAPEREARSRTLPAVTFIGALALVGGVAWWMWTGGDNAPVNPNDLPLVMAESTEAKVRPSDEGGLKIDGLDKEVYNEMSPGSAPATAEKVLPDPEAPVAPPQPPSAMQPAGNFDIGALARSLEGSDATAPAEGLVPGAGSEAAPETPAVTTTGNVPVFADDAGTQTAALPPADQADVAVAAGGVRIQLAAFRSADQARTAWSKMQQDHPRELSELQLVIEQADLGAKGTFFRLQAGPVAGRDTAASLCGRLKQQDQPCIVIGP